MIDRIVFVLLLPFIIVAGALYYLVLIYWLIRGKDWDKFPFPW